ncbi:MAG: hypothetical protein DA446_01265 [Bacteroidetes bacterium]|nr:MAG: hypothetical protein DA446_01265 [Bacteroidota bacterium]
MIVNKEQTERLQNMLNQVLLNIGIGILLSLCFSVFYGTHVHAQQIITYLDRDSVRIGDTFQISYVVKGTYDRLFYPDETTFEGDPIVLKVERFRESSSTDSLVYTLQYFQNEDVIIPAQPITLRSGDSDTTIYTNRIPVFFKSSLQDSVSQFRPMKENYAFSSGILPYLFLLLIPLLGAILFWLKHKKRSSLQPKQRNYLGTEFEDPLILLKREIRELRTHKDIRSHDQADQFYVQLGDSIRRYIKRVYDFPALEMTSGEIVRGLVDHYASSSVIEKTRRVLMEADMVKFAKMTPEEESILSALHVADEFIDTVERDDSARLEELRLKHIDMERLKKEEFEQSGGTP